MVGRGVDSLSRNREGEIAVFVCDVNQANKQTRYTVDRLSMFHSTPFTNYDPKEQSNNNTSKFTPVSRVRYI